MSLWAVAFLGTTPIGGPIAGYVAESAGGRAGLLMGGVACLLAAGAAMALPLATRARDARAPQTPPGLTRASQTRDAPTSPDVTDERRAHADCQAARMRSDAELLAGGAHRCGRVPRALRALRRAHLRLPPAAQPRRARRARPDGGDVRAGLALACALPRRGAAARPAPGCSGSPATCCSSACVSDGSSAARASGSACSTASIASRRPSPTTAWLEGLDEALAHLPEAQQRGDPAAGRRGPRLRRGRRAAGDHAPGCARARLARPQHAAQAPFRFHGDDPMTELDPQLDATRRPPRARRRRRSGNRRAAARQRDRRADLAALRDRDRRARDRDPGAAIAADQLISTDDVAQSLPAGTSALEGTEPTCTVVTKDVEFHCVLAKARRPRSRIGRARSSRPSTRASTSTAAAARSRATAESGSAISARPLSTRRSSARASSASTRPRRASAEPARVHDGV